MDVHLISVDVYPDVLSVEDIDRIMNTFLMALRDPQFDTWKDNYQGYNVIVTKPHPKRTLSRFYMLASNPRGMNVEAAIRDATQDTNNSSPLHADLKPRHVRCWKVDMARCREFCREEDDGDDITDLFEQFNNHPPEEQVTFYFPPDMTSEQKTKFDQIVDASFRGEYQLNDDSSDGGCEGGSGFTLRTGPHGHGSGLPDFNALTGRWGVWSENSQKHLVPTKDPQLRYGQIGTEMTAVIYSLWICWMNDEIRFRFIHQGLRCRDSLLLEGMDIPDSAGFWYAMENFGGCYGRESRRLFWGIGPEKE